MSGRRRGRRDDRRDRDGPGLERRDRGPSLECVEPMPPDAPLEHVHMTSIARWIEDGARL
ncbi:MAG: hypothetical protein H6713_17880 [Myxococcales bacterium]|nr:hypothetical protein [Myxococcales bacterium]